MNKLALAWHRLTRLGAFAFWAALAGVNTGCSTEPVPYTNPDPPETAWYAYQNCIAAYGSRATVCNNVGYSNVQGTYYYTGVADTASLGYEPVYTSSGAVINGGINYTGASANSYRGVRAVSPSAIASKAPSAEAGGSFDPEALRALDEQTLQDLTEQWLELAKKAP